MTPSNQVARGLKAYGEHNPPPDINPADYPHRLLVPSADAETKPTLLMWFDADPLPFDLDALEAITNTLATGGGLFVMARDPDVLTRVRSAIAMIAATPPGGWQ